MKRNFKTRALCLLLAIITLSMTSCGQFTDAELSSNSTEEAQQTDEIENEQGKFSVSLLMNGKPYVPISPVSVTWTHTEGHSVHTAEIGEDGTASVTGLDGDYTVTLSELPQGFAYNANIYKATNDDPNIIIDVHRIITTRGEGADLYDCININSTGVYTVDLNSADHVVMFEFSPQQMGTYSVESWLPITNEMLNPRADVYTGNSQFKVFSHTQDVGGVCGSYTRNFKFDVEIAAESIGQSFTFGIKVVSKDGTYPAKVTFAVQLDGEFYLDLPTSTIIVPSFDLVKAPDYDPAEYEFVGAEIEDRGNYIFDGKMYGLNEEDGYYHMINETTGKFDGPILFAKISQPCRFFDDAFTTLEYRGNKALTVNGGTENYKLFIEGFGALAGGMGRYFCAEDCPCLATNGGACLESAECEKCTENCRPCPDAGYGHAGYAGYCNSDGVYPVTEELKDFLQKYSVSQLLFRDGNGHVETHETIKVNATEDDQWLFACGYYKKK